MLHFFDLLSAIHTRNIMCSTSKTSQYFPDFEGVYKATVHDNTHSDQRFLSCLITEFTNSLPFLLCNIFGTSNVNNIDSNS